MSVAKIIWGALNLFSVIPATYLILKFRIRSTSLLESVILAILLFASFSFRNNLGQGQVITWLVVLGLSSILLSQVDRLSNDLIASILLVPIIEIKPYLAIGLLSYFVFLRKIRLVGFVSIVLLILNLIYEYVLGLTYLDWLSALGVRSKSVSSGDDQAAISSILKFNFNMNSKVQIFFTFIYFLFILILLYRSRKNLSENPIALAFVLPCALSPFLHAHDVFFALVGLFLSIGKFKLWSFKQKVLLLAISVIYLGWTSDQLLFGLSIYLAGVPFRNIWGGLIGVASFSYLLFFHYGLSLETYSRIHAYNLASLLLVVLVLGLLSTSEGRSVNEMSDLSLPRDNIGWDS
jgi:hypothetical protein